MRAHRMLQLFVLAAAFCSPAVHAQQQGGVQVRGDTQINVRAGDVNTIAVGQNNTARTSIGSVKGNTRSGTSVTVDVKNVSNVAAGRGKKSCVNIGVVGADAECK